MKKLLTLAALLGLASCTVNFNPVNDSEVTLTVGVKSTRAETKAETVAGTTDENKVNSIQVFVFKVNNGTYVFEAAARSAASSVDITVTTGQKDVIILVNEPSDYVTTVTERDVLLAKVSSLAQNSSSSYVMFGETTGEVSATSHTIDVPVDRLASRVRISKITNKLRNGNAGKNVKVSRVFLSNAGATVTYAAARNGFYATAGINSKLDLNGTAVSGASEKASVNALIYKNINSDVIADESSYSTPISLYAYPNDNAIKPTCLIVEMEIAGRFFTYPVELPAMAANTTLEVSEMVITSIGNVSNGDDILDPGEDQPVEFQENTFSVTVKPWTVVPVATDTDGKYTI